MVGLVATNAKLEQRAVRLLGEATGADGATCAAALSAAEGQLPVALVALLAGCSPGQARAALAEHPSVRSAVAALARPSPIQAVERLTPSITAGVDVGGGGIRLSAEVDGVRSRFVETGATHRNGRLDLASLSDRIATLLTRSFQGGGSGAVVAIGLTGLPGAVADPGVLWERLHTRFGLGLLVVAGDAVTTHLGALRGRPGVVVAAGTGVIALGTDLDQVWRQADGWGMLLGDHGGGAWIGRQAIDAALRAHDRRVGGSPLLLDHLRTRVGHPRDLVSRLYDCESPAHELASFTPVVAAAARAGDPVAQRIWHDAGRHLGDAAVAVAAGLDPVVSWGGGLFAAGDLLLEPFRRTVRAGLPDARLVAPDGDAVAGALALAAAAGQGKLSSHPPYMYLFS
jgi:N-acetylglucosamine kinase-like BadF-type ATPase